jgi:hypothetical protein
MRRMTRRLLLALVLAFGACTHGSQLGTQTTVPEPPPPRTDDPARERPDFFWIHGHWTWKTNRWDWASGHWEHARTGYVWTEGRWDLRAGLWQYTDGAWTAGEAPATPPVTGP